MTNTNPIAGEAICFTGIFRDWDKPDGEQGDLIDPQFIKWTLYDRRWRIIAEENIGSAHKISTGEYRHFHVIEEQGDYYYEWKAEHENLPIVERRQIVVGRIRKQIYQIGIRS